MISDALLLDRYRFLLEAEMSRALELVAKRDSSKKIYDFDIRGKLYQLAMNIAPLARHGELQALQSWIDPLEGTVSADIAAGSGFLTLVLAKWTNAKTYAIDPSLDQLRALEAVKMPNIVCVQGSFEEEKNSLNQITEELDLITSLGGLHHIFNQEQMMMNIERFLKPGGRFAAADVEANSVLADHFDRVVASKCITSHQALWLSKERLLKLIQPYKTLELTRAEQKDLTWVFDSEHQMALFFKGLHAYNLPEQTILNDLAEVLEYSRVGPKVHLRWPLLFFEIKKQFPRYKIEGVLNRFKA